MKIAFVDLSTKLETIHDLESRARGGMVTSLFKVSDYLAQFADVEVLSDIEEEGVTEAGVKWKKEPESPYDFLILNRGVGSGYGYIEAKHRILWTHDLPHTGFIPDPRTIKAFTTVFMSKYAERVWREMYPDIGKSFLIPNGVDKKIFHPIEKDLDYLIYASAPNRGLSRLPFIFDCIRTRIDRDLYMAAFSNSAVLHPGESDQWGDNVYNPNGLFRELEKGWTESETDLIEYRDPVPQEELAKELGQAGLMIIPSDLAEICSNIILQSLACGTPVITTGRLGSAPEWINHKNGRLTKFSSNDYVIYQIEIMRFAVEILENEKLHRKLIKGATSTKIHDWQDIGSMWWKMLRKLR